MFSLSYFSLLSAIIGNILNLSLYYFSFRQYVESQIMQNWFVHELKILKHFQYIFHNFIFG
jgi:hypothetical protein